nr:unnamed protein product [Callosobruchus analis]
MAKRRACSVLGCITRADDSVFRVPDSKKSWDTCIEWIKATGNPKFRCMNKYDRSKVFICSKHFTDKETVIIKMRSIKNYKQTLNLPEPLNVHFGINAASTENMESYKLTASGQKRKDPPSAPNNSEKKILTELSMRELQNLSITKEVIYGTDVGKKMKR